MGAIVHILQIEHVLGVHPPVTSNVVTFVVGFRKRLNDVEFVHSGHAVNNWSSVANVVSGDRVISVLPNGGGVLAATNACVVPAEGNAQSQPVKKAIYASSV